MIHINNNSISKLFTILVLVITINSCSKDLDDLQPATFPAIGEVFINEFSAGLEYAAFGGSDVRAFKVVRDEVYDGDAAMRFAVPDVGDPAGAYAGGAFFVEGGRNLSGFDALTFWAKASKSANIDIIGFGNDLGENKYVASITDVAVNTNWKQYIIPIPDPSVLTQEKGLFFYSEGPENGLGYTFWIDEVKFEKLGTLGQFEPGIKDKQDAQIGAETGQNIPVDGLVLTVNLPTGIDQKINVAPRYFNFSSSNTSVATVSRDGIATILDAGTSVITAKLGEIDALGSLTITSTGEPFLPPKAPVPTRNQDSVISLWCNVYNDVNVDTWDANYQFSNAEVDFVQVDGDDIIRYRNLNFVGIEFKNPTINITSMTHFHMNIYTPDPTDLPANFKVLLADAGPNNNLGDSDDKLHELTFTSPTLVTNNWVTIDVPLSNFTGLTTRANLVQMVLSGTLPNVFVDNVYFYISDGNTSGGGDCTPLDASLTTSFPINFENCQNLSGVFEAGDGVTGYPNSNPNTNGNSSTRVYQFNKVLGSAWYSGIFHIFPSNFDMTTNKVFKIKIRSPKPNVKVRFQIEKEGGGAVTYQKTATVTNANTWTELTFDFTDQPLIDGFTVYDKIVIIPDDADNGPADGSIYFIDDITLSAAITAPTQPKTPAPTPTRNPADVISVFSDQYTNINVSDFNPNWGQSGTVSQVSIAGNNTLKYSNFNYQGTQFNMSENLSAMEFVHIDMWTADATNVKFTPISSGTGEFLVGLTPITQGQWKSYDIPLSSFSGMSFNDIIQLKFDGQGGVNPSNIWLDNIYFYKAPGGGSGPCPTPQSPSLTTSFPINFENCEDLSGVFEAGDGVTGFPVQNPKASGINTSGRVYKMNKVVGAAWYSGIYHIFPSNFNMTSNKVFKMKVWSPKPNVIVRFQIEKEGNQGPIVTYSHTAVVTNANTWTELTFDFSGDALSGPMAYDKIVIIPDDQDNGPADGSIYYIDDIILTN
jgi:hypothetical protein